MARSELSLIQTVYVLAPDVLIFIFCCSQAQRAREDWPEHAVYEGPACGVVRIEVMPVLLGHQQLYPVCILHSTEPVHRRADHTYSINCLAPSIYPWFGEQGKRWNRVRPQSGVLVVASEAMIYIYIYI